MLPDERKLSGRFALASDFSSELALLRSRLLRLAKDDGGPQQLDKLRLLLLGVEIVARIGSLQSRALRLTDSGVGEINSLLWEVSEDGGASG